MAETKQNYQLKLNVERQTTLINAIRLGTPLATAALFADVDKESIRHWRRKGEDARKMAPSTRTPTQQRYVDFVVELNKALAEAALVAQRTVHSFMSKALNDPDNPVSVEDKRLALDASKFYLTHRDGKNYNPRVEITGEDGGPVAVVSGGIDVWEKMQAILKAERENDDE